MKKIKCLNCEIEFEVDNYREGSAKYCSKDCSIMHKSKSIKCCYCGKKFRRAKSLISASNYCSLACKRVDPELKQKISESNKLTVNPGQFRHGHSINNGKRMSVDTEFKPGWQKTKRGREIIRSRIKNIVKSPNKKENILIEAISVAELPLEFVDDGAIVIGSKCPDFIGTDGQKVIVELYGDYWHSPKKCKYWHQTESGVKKYYSEYGYRTLVIWENELKDINFVIDKIIDFIYSSIVVDNVPIDAATIFQKYADNEFEGNTGMALKKLVDLVLIEPLPFMQINAVLESHEERLCKIEKGLNGSTKDDKKRALTGNKEVYSGQRGTEKKEGIENE